MNFSQSEAYVTFVLMKRRQVIQSILGLPAITALPAVAQEQAKARQAPAPEGRPANADDATKLAMGNAEAFAVPAHDFFAPQQFETLRRLCDLLVPAMTPKPGAKEAGVAEFLDFLVRRSPRDRQVLYQGGLDRLNRESQARFSRPFTEVTAVQASELLAPLREPWTFQGPSGELARFLAAVKDDALRATVSSREWADASSGRRGGRGIGAYWYSLE